MAKLHDDPIRIVPKHVLFLSLFISVIMMIAVDFLEWPMIKVLSGFWIGVITNLVSFRLIIISTGKLVEKAAGRITSMSLMMFVSFLGRFGLYSISLFLVARFIGIYGLLASAMGVSMVGLAIKLNAFFPHS
jgi:hypothetical protein